MDFSSQQQKKKEGALHTDRPVFEFPNHTAEFPNQWLCMPSVGPNDGAIHRLWRTAQK